MLPLELKPTETRIWHDTGGRPINFADCDRLRINPNTIELDCGRQTFVISLQDNPLYVDCQGIYLSIETCPN